jgi:putative hemolysin
MTDTASIALPARAPPHIVDTLIEERAPRLARHWSWPLLRPALYAGLDYAKARRMADTIAPMVGRDALMHISGLLSLQITARGLRNVPASGRVVLVANHPTGIGDGVAVWDALRAHRPDTCFYANSDAHRVCPRFDDVLIPVEWVYEKRTRERTRVTLKMTADALEAERALVIFPAGRLARLENGRPIDPEWMASAVSVARKYNAPVVPVHVSGPYSWAFHTFDRFSGELRDITLFYELLNKRGRPFTITFAPPVPVEALGTDAAQATAALKRFIEFDLADKPNARFQSV